MEARQRGQVPKSQEITTVAVLMAGLTYLMIAGPGIMSQMHQIVHRCLSGADGRYAMHPGSMQWLFSYVTLEIGSMVLPLALVLAAVGVASNIGQFGFLLTFQPLQPKLGSLNPISGVKKLFGWRGLIESFKSVIKFLIVGVFLITFIRSLGPELLALTNCPLRFIPGKVAGLVLGIAWRIIAALLVLAIADLLYQRFDYKRNLKMTKVEVKDERKQQEGDEKTRSRIRAKQMQITRNRMFAAVPKANVVITNPVHVAVALRYEPGGMVAPQVVAKGQRLMAERIKSIARQHGIPVVERPPLARLLFKTVRVGHSIPEALYQAVAEILAHVYQTRPAARPQLEPTTTTAGSGGDRLGHESGVHVA